MVTRTYGLERYCEEVQLGFVREDGWAEGRASAEVG